MLTLVLVLTSVSLSVAQGKPAPSGQMELCVGSGSVIVFVDENGDPTGPPHFCPDCMVHVLGGVLPPDLPIGVIAEPHDMARPSDSAVTAEQPAIPATARGPPCNV